MSVSNLERRNPAALLEVEKEHLRKQIANYNEGLASHAALCERLMAQVRSLEKEEQQLRANTTAQIRSGNRRAAAESALQFQTVKGQLAENRKQLEQAETTYKELLRAREVAIRGAQEKLETLKQNIDDLKVRRATAEMTEMAAGMTAKLGGSADTLERLAKMVDEERQLAAGRTRVARDSIPDTGAALGEDEHRALAEQALVDFAAEEDIALETRVLPYRSTNPGNQTE
ncbi:MAG: hypothetical protein DLM52_06290 [Chthoniobacterales bacterium]|nr:MAG: hypothetical protein DLM52_06290 [Chthoniobacterales bacterium]